MTLPVPSFHCSWIDKPNALISVGFDIFVGKIDGIREEFNADRKGDKLSTIVDGLQKSANQSLITQLLGKKVIVSTGKNNKKSTMLTGLPASVLLKFQLPQHLQDIVKAYSPAKKAPPPAASVDAFAKAFGSLTTAQPAPVVPPVTNALTPEQEDLSVALAGKELFKSIARNLRPIMQKDGATDDESVMMFRVVDKDCSQELASSLFRSGEIATDDGSMFMSFGFLKTFKVS